MKRLISLVLMLSLVLVIGQVMVLSASSSEKVDVIIGFKGAPNPALVSALGGGISTQFTIIPAVSASIPASAVKALQNNPHIAYVEPNIEVVALQQSVPWGISHIGATTVHAGGNKGTGVKVAVIDTGIQADHPDLAANIRGGYNFVGGNTNYHDDNGHGSHVSGTIAAVDNTIGVIGVAPEAHLYGVKVLNSSGSGTMDQIIAGIEWAMNNNMNVINMSLGASSGTTALETACNAAYAAGVVIVAAAGNSGNFLGWFNTVNYPAKYSSVIAVSAVNSGNTRPSWSSHGAEVELAAPGVDIPSTWLNSGYNTISGTSMASPHVAGVAALVKAKYSSWTNLQIRDRMNQTALDIGSPGRDNLYGYGLVQAIGATN